MQLDKYMYQETERLILRRLKASDAQAIYKFRNNRDNFPFLDISTYSVIEEAVDYINRCNINIDQNNFLLYGIELKKTSECIGTIALWNFSDDKKTVELGYILFQGFQNQGYMIEAAGKAIEVAKTLEVDLIEAFTHKYHFRSIQMLEKLGFQYERTYFETDTHTSKLLPLVVYQFKTFKPL
ncbi:MAG: GNAT family N-acetyltransferase [Acholeplasmataceae bacterium]|nr:GNAT family N-acetyltransferase [Acholeplasmataceae bacterium]